MYIRTIIISSLSLCHCVFVFHSNSNVDVILSTNETVMLSWSSPTYTRSATHIASGMPDSPSSPLPDPESGWNSTAGLMDMLWNSHLKFNPGKKWSAQCRKHNHPTIDHWPGPQPSNQWSSGQCRWILQWQLWALAFQRFALPKRSCTPWASSIPAWFPIKHNMIMSINRTMKLKIEWRTLKTKHVFLLYMYGKHTMCLSGRCKVFGCEKKYFRPPLHQYFHIAPKQSVAMILN